MHPTLQPCHLFRATNSNNKMKKIAIYGAGGLGGEVACVINAINAENPEWDFIGYFDDGLKPGDANRYGQVLGGIDALNKYDADLNIVFSIANPQVIKKLVAAITNPHIFFPNIFAPGVLFYDKQSLTIGKGNVFLFASRISCNVVIGDFNICNSGISLGHDVKLGSYNILGPMVRLSGNTTVGNFNFFGVQSIILQGVTVGSHTTVGVASVVMRKTKDGFLYFGNPARKVEVR
jgi:sugar O-acyltransferase (sialic acid O-acetyltransferase NeuD family)